MERNKVRERWKQTQRAREMKKKQGETERERGSL